MSFFKRKQSKSNAEKSRRLKDRAVKACSDTTDYELMLRDFCNNNSKNMKLLVEVAGYRSYLNACGLSSRDSAKETLEKFRQ